MAAIVLADVTALFAEITAVPAVVLAWVNGNGIAVDVFDGEDGDTTKIARCSLAAHMATLFPTATAGAAGPITSETEGGISRAYGAIALTPSELNRTPYGQQFRWLCRMNAGGAWLAR